MARNFRELEAEMPLEVLQRSKARALEMMLELLQQQTADEMTLADLRRVVQALGGKLEVVARLPGGDIQL